MPREEAGFQASNWGRKPQPVLSLLRLAQEMVEDAAASIRQSEEEKKDPIGRSEILPAYVEIMLTVDNIQAAQSAAEELAEIAKNIQSSYLQAVATRAIGKVLLAKGESRAALDKLRHVWSIFKNINASYEFAKTRVLIGRFCRDWGIMTLQRWSWMLPDGRSASLGLSTILEKFTPTLNRPPYLIRMD